MPCQLWPCYRHLMDSGQSSLSLSYKVLRAFKPIPGRVCVIKRLSRIVIGSTINTRFSACDRDHGLQNSVTECVIKCGQTRREIALYITALGRVSQQHVPSVQSFEILIAD